MVIHGTNYPRTPRVLFCVGPQLTPHGATSASLRDSGVVVLVVLVLLLLLVVVIVIAVRPLLGRCRSQLSDG